MATSHFTEVTATIMLHVSLFYNLDLLTFNLQKQCMIWGFVKGREIKAI